LGPLLLYVLLLLLLPLLALSLLLLLRLLLLLLLLLLLRLLYQPRRLHCSTPAPDPLAARTAYACILVVVL
jgi:hypothetical protein